jgi:hypothetical protein
MAGCSGFSGSLIVVAGVVAIVVGLPSSSVSGDVGVVEVGDAVMTISSHLVLTLLRGKVRELRRSVIGDMASDGGPLSGGESEDVFWVSKPRRSSDSGSTRKETTRYQQHVLQGDGGGYFRVLLIDKGNWLEMWGWGAGVFWVRRCWCLLKLVPLTFRDTLSGSSH